MTRTTVRARSNQRQRSRFGVAILVVNEQPVGRNVTLACAFVLAREIMVAVLLVQWAVIHQFLHDGAHLLPVIAP